VTTEQIPLIFQYNKRDIRVIQTVDKLNEVLNPNGAPWFEAAALHGIGVFETLKCVSRQALQSVRRKIADEARRKPEPVPAPVVPVPAPVAVVEAPPLPEPPADPLASLVADPAPAEDIPVEFAEEDTGRHKVRPVATKAQMDIQQELEKLRTLTTAPRPGTAYSGEVERRVMERRIRDIMVLDRDARQDVKRKMAVEISPDVLKTSTGLRLHLTLDGPEGEHVLKDTLTVKLVGNRKLDRLMLHLEIDLKGKADTQA
jgi:hypothetical protein